MRKGIGWRLPSSRAARQGRIHLNLPDELYAARMYRILDISYLMSSIQYMEPITALTRLSTVLREARKRRGLTQAQVAALAGVPRLKVIQVEKGAASVSAGAYAAVAAALGMEFSLVPERRPTLEEVPELLKHE